jgi:hypothetical protein
VERGDFRPGYVTLVSLSGVSNTLRTALPLVMGEPMTGIEPAYSAWEVDSGRPREYGSVRKPLRAAESHPCEYVVVRVSIDEL